MFKTWKNIFIFIQYIFVGPPLIKTPPLIHTWHLCRTLNYSDPTPSPTWRCRVAIFVMRCAVWYDLLNFKNVKGKFDLMQLGWCQFFRFYVWKARVSPEWKARVGFWELLTKARINPEKRNFYGGDWDWPLQIYWLCYIL